MHPTKIHIKEENIYFFWGLLSVICIGAATYLIINSFIAYRGNIAGYRQLISLLLLSLGGYGIVRITAPLYTFNITVDEALLTIKTWKDTNTPLAVTTISLQNIDMLRVQPHVPRSPREAFFDFSSDYDLLYHNAKTGRWQKLLDPNDDSFTLKVEDIRRIIDFLLAHNADIYIDDTTISGMAYHSRVMQ